MKEGRGTRARRGRRRKKKGGVGQEENTWSAAGVERRKKASVWEELTITGEEECMREQAASTLMSFPKNENPSTSLIARVAPLIASNTIQACPLSFGVLAQCTSNTLPNWQNNKYRLRLSSLFFSLS